MNDITKGDIVNFTKSYKMSSIIHHKHFYSVCYTIDMCDRLILHDKPNNYILNEWEYNTVLYNNNPSYMLIDLRPFFEKYYRPILRSKKIKKILNG